MVNPLNQALQPLNQAPQWMRLLLSKEFFTPCLTHERRKRNERNFFCLECCLRLCQHCLLHHHGHNMLQVRKYLYQDVVNLDDMQNVIDCDLVQSYIANGAKVVFLKARSQMGRPTRDLGGYCGYCCRCMHYSFKFCSVACKVSASFRDGKNWKDLLPQCNSWTICDSDSEEVDQQSPKSVVNIAQAVVPAWSSAIANDDEVNQSTEQNDTATDGIGREAAANEGLGRKATPDVPNERKSIHSFRKRSRKGIPHRSPLQ